MLNDTQTKDGWLLLSFIYLTTCAIGFPVVLVTILVFLSFVLAPFAFLLSRIGRAGFLAILPAGLFAAFASFAPRVIGGEVFLEKFDWIPSLGISISFRVDGLSLLFSLLITGIGSGVFLYASEYLKHHPDRSKFLAYLTLFMGAMLGAVLADNLVLMLIFWELTSITSFLLIGFDHEKLQARLSAQQGLLVTVAGGLALTAGIILLGQTAGSYQLSELLNQGDHLAASTASTAMIVLICLGAFTKSAQTPFHFWLPNAMVAPTPASAYLHSATMVKLGVYLLARFDPIFGKHDLWMTLLPTIGLLTMLTSAVLMLRETDLKRILAYSTLTALGTMVLLVGFPDPIAAVAMASFLIVHALYKACLFMIAGAIDHEAGTRDSSQLRGLRRAMPFTAAVAGLGGLSMAGLPPFIGFIGKELVYEANLAGPMTWLVVGIAVFANAATIVAAGVVSWRCFWGAAIATPEKAHDPPLAMLVGPGCLAVLGLVFGIMPWAIEGIVGRAAEALAGHELSVHLKLWHGFNSMLMLSLLTIAIGVLALSAWTPIRQWLASFRKIDRFGPSATYDRFLASVIKFSTWQTRLIQSGSLHSYLAITFTTVVLSLAAGLIMFQGVSLPTISSEAWHPVSILSVLLVIASIAVVRAESFMAGIVAAGMVGFLMALVYLFRGAPDLAFTQFSIEALSVVIILTIVGRMPMHEPDMRIPSQRRRDLTISIGFGVVVTLILLSISSLPFNDQLSQFYRIASVAEAHGHNVVNVIIVDFRGLDTLGEVTVLALAAISASSLLFKFSSKRRLIQRNRRDNEVDA